MSAKPDGRRHTISVVVPVFNESAVARAFFDRASQVIRAIPAKNIAAGDSRLRLLHFSRKGV